MGEPLPEADHPFMPKQLRARRVRIVMLWLALLMLAAVGTATVVTLQRAAESFTWVEHTYQVIGGLQEFRATIRDAESSARGYRLTRNPALRAQFFRDEPTVAAQLQRLGTQVSDNPTQTERLHRLADLSAERLALSRTLMTLPPEAALPVQLLNAGTHTMERIEGVVRPMLATETSLLALRRERTAWERRLLLGVTLGGTVVSALLLLWLMRGLALEIVRSRMLEKQSREAAAGLERSLGELALVSEQRGALARYASLLQSCHDIEEALRITGHVVAEVLPDTGGRCYLLRASQDLAETAIAFGTPAVASAEILQPTQCWALRRGRPYLVPQLADGVACSHVGTQTVPGGGWSLCVPLLAQGTALGLLHVSGNTAAGRDAAPLLMESVAEQLGLALVNLQLREKLRMQSLRDPLTGLYNRRYLDESLQREVVRCQRRGLPLAVLMLDVDHFKAFNDGNGHAAGDALLAAIARTLQSCTRSEDLACRYGGEEFTVVLVDTDAADAMARAEQIRGAIESTAVQHLKRTLGPCTASVGLAVLSDTATTPSELLEQADAALYRAKAGGRNRVVTAQPERIPVVSQSR
jgi:diguanylate cyclase (GGDEF)-like protein